MRKITLLVIPLAVFVALVLVGCGGGGGY